MIFFCVNSSSRKDDSLAYQKEIVEGSDE